MKFQLWWLRMMHCNMSDGNFMHWPDPESGGAWTADQPQFSIDLQQNYQPRAGTLVFMAKTQHLRLQVEFT